MRLMTTALLPALALMACSSYELAGKDYADSGYSDDTGYSAAEDNDGDGFDEEPGAETEDDFLALRPMATEGYVFVVNASRNTVSRISVPGLEVVTVEVGVTPAVALSTPDGTQAVVFNEGSDDVSIIDAETLEVTTVTVRDNFNSMVLSPDGRWAACFRDQDLDSDSPTTGGAQSFNELSLVNVETGEHHLKIVGHNPRQVAFSADATQAVVVSDEYVAVLDLTQDNPPVSMVQVAVDLLDPPVAEEVAMSPNGEFAFLRQFGTDELVIIDLLTELVDRVPVGQNPTDIDLSPDGTQAVVVSRGSNELYVFDALDPTIPPEVLAMPENELLGSIQFSPDGDRAVLYTTAADIAHYTTWDRRDGTFDVRSLRKPPKGVGLSPDGQTMMVFHEASSDSPDTPTSSPYYGSDALTLISLQDFRENPLLLAAPPLAYANSTDGSYGFFIMENQPYLEVVNWGELHHTEVRLRSVPVHVGVLPGTTFAFVNQEHELGRLSFYDPSTEVLETITGFELNSGIEH